MPADMKETIAQAAKSLLMDEGIRKLTVKDIVEKCRITRQTFYYHFEDIYDLVRWMFQEEAISLLKRQEGVLLWQEGLLQLFQYLQENRAVCLCALNSLSRNHLKHFFYTDLYSIIRHTVITVADEVGLASGEEGDLELFTHFYVIALAGLVESWLLGEIDKTPEELIRFTDKFLRDQMRGSVLRQTQQDGKEDVL